MRARRGTSALLAASQAREEDYTLLEKPFNIEQLARGLSEVFGPRT